MKPNPDIITAICVFIIIALLGWGFMWYVDTYAERQGTSAEASDG